MPAGLMPAGISDVNGPDIHWISKIKNFGDGRCQPLNLYYLSVNKLAVAFLDCLPAYCGCGGCAKVKISMIFYPYKADLL